MLLRSRRLLAGLLSVLLAAVLATAVAAPASAHNTLRSTSPADGAQLDSPPQQVSLSFDEDAIEVGTEISVSGPAGPVDVAPPAVSGPTVSAALPPDLPAGAYTVEWRVTSVDGHPISGTFAFTVTAPPPTSSAPAPTATATDAPTGVPTAAAAPRAGDATGGSGGIPLPVLLVLAGLVVVALAAGLLLRRRRG
jgi:hypothetical protein